MNERLFNILNSRQFFKWIPDKMFLKFAYKTLVRRKLNLDNPQTFNEKLQWLKLYDRKPIYSTMVDKYDAKEYVASKIGEEHIIPTLGVWNHFDDIDFNSLPNQFVLKCTHDSGGLVICKDKSKLDKMAAKKKIEKCLKRNFYLTGREWPYKNVKPRIIAEKYMEDIGKSSTSEKQSRDFDDYKLHSFNGEPKVILVCRDRFSELGFTEDFFDQNWRHLDVKREKHPNSNKVISHPKELDRMLELARILSKDMSFLRSDFYTIGGKVYFGELTFFPASGVEKFVPGSFDKKIGDWIKLPEKVGGEVLLRSGNCYVLVSIKVESNQKARESAPLRDYKIYTFNGNAKLCMINQDRGIHTRADYFDRDYNQLDFTWGYDHADVLPEKPQNYERMYELAEKLAAGTPVLRVDFYEVNGRVYFGELTFFDGSGFDRIEPVEWDYKLGSLVRLPQKNV